MKKLAALAGVGVAALAVRRYRAMSPAMEKVAPELRTPVLPFVSVGYTAKTLPLIRVPYRIKTPAGRGVTVATRNVGAVRVLVTTPIEGDVPRRAVLCLHGGGMIVGSPQLEFLFRALGKRPQRGRGLSGLSPRPRKPLSRRP